MQFRRAGQPIDEFIAEFDLLRRKAESKMETGAGYPKQVASLLRMHNAGLPRQEKSPAMASSRRNLRFAEAAANMRRLFGSRGGGGRQEAWIPEEANGP